MSKGRHHLIATHALHSMIGADFPVDEQSIKAAMSPTWEVDHSNPFDAIAWAIAMAKTASVFIVGQDARDFAFNGRAEDSAEGQHLPPMPFKRMILEVHDKDGPLVWGLGSTLIGGPTTSLGLNDGRDLRSVVRVVALLVSERVVGESWDLATVVQRVPDTFFVDDKRVDIRGLEDHLVSAAYNVWTYTLTADGEMTPKLLDDDDLGRYWQAWTAHHVINAMHLITAKGIWTGEKQMHRKQHRRFEREHGGEMPPVYWVDMSGPEDREGAAGGGTRDWSHRWLVRGHWRQYRVGTDKRGRKFTGKRSWIPSYVKGPDRDKHGKPTVLRRPVHTLVPGMSGQEIVVKPEPS